MSIWLLVKAAILYSHQLPLTHSDRICRVRRGQPFADRFKGL